MKDILRLVESILVHYPETRDDDFILYGYTCFNVRQDVWSKSFGHVMKNHKKLGLPAYESVTRARRKLQELRPELRGQKYLQRQSKQQEYKNTYGRSSS